MLIPLVQNFDRNTYSAFGCQEFALSGNIESHGLLLLCSMLTFQDP